MKSSKEVDGIKRMAPGKWRIRVPHGYKPMRSDPSRLSPNHITRTIKGTRQDAILEKARIIEDIDGATVIERSKVTLGEYMQNWLGDYASRYARSTFRNWRAIARDHVIPVLGQIKLQKLNATSLREYYANRERSGRINVTEISGKGLSATTVLQHHRFIHIVLSTARDEGIIKNNPADRVKPPRPRRQPVEVWNVDQCAKLYKGLEGERLRVPVIIALLTGMRRGEYLGLRWKDVDFQRGLITIRQVIQQADRVIDFKEPKTHRSARPIEMPPLLVDELRKHMTRQKASHLNCGVRWSENGLICANEDGSPMKPNTVSSAWPHLLERIGLPKLPLKNLRHTHASLMLLDGVDGGVVKQRMGHATAAFTLDFYGHVMPGMQRAASDQINSSLVKAINDDHEFGQDLDKTGDLEQ